MDSVDEEMFEIIHNINSGQR